MVLLHNDLENMYIKFRKLWQVSEIGLGQCLRRQNLYKIFNTITKS